MNKDVSNITINNARIIFRNFAGKEGKFNPAGKRNFCVCLDPETAEMLRNDGWNIKQLQPREEGDAPQDYIQVAVNYEGKIQPKIWLKTSESKTLLDEDSVNVLDYAEISNVDLIIRPYCWELAAGKSGIKAYVKTMFVTIVEDELEKRYSNVPDSATRTSDMQQEELPWN